MGANWIKKVLFSVIIGGLFLPIVQKKFSLVYFHKLGGAISRSEWVPFTFDGFFSGDFQSSKEASIKADFGFNQFFIRLNNQIEFDLYGKVRAKGVIFGKEGFLFEEGYINAALGLDFIGEDSIRCQLSKLKLVSDSLKAYGVDVVVLLAPGKGSFCQEYIPDVYKSTKGIATNVNVYSQILDEFNIPTLDVNRWFLSLKDDKADYDPLFSKTGIHWSYFAENMVTDSLLNFLRSTTGNVFPSRSKIGQFKSKIALKRDGDVWEGMNLLRPFDEFELSYPSFKRVGGESNRTKVLTISDSYYWGMFYDSLSSNYFKDGRFWYYYKEVFPESYSKFTSVDELNLKKELVSNDVILLICTDANLPRFGFGFIDEAFTLFSK